MRILSGFLLGCLMFPASACHRPTDPWAEAMADQPILPTDPPPAAGDPATFPATFPAPVTCGSPLPGPPLKAEVTEALPGYADDLAALDLSRLPDPYDYSADSKLAITVINYMLGRSSGSRITHAEALQRGGLGRAVLGAAAKGTAGRIDFAFLRRGLHYFYACSRPLPKDLTQLRLRYGDYRIWPAHEIPCSRPKDGPRRLYADPELGVYVAETVVSGKVRETEVLLTSLRRDGQIDFAAYTSDGALSDRSSFATSGSSTTTAAPYTCISCHLDSAAGGVSRLFPTGTGAGCR
jgi:hypothetical protein